MRSGMALRWVVMPAARRLYLKDAKTLEGFCLPCEAALGKKPRSTSPFSPPSPSSPTTRISPSGASSPLMRITCCVTVQLSRLLACLNLISAQLIAHQMRTRSGARELARVNEIRRHVPVDFVLLMFMLLTTIYSILFPSCSLEYMLLRWSYSCIFERMPLQSGTNLYI